MRKKFLGVIAIVAIAALAGYNLYSSQNKNVELSDLALANVEALARYESHGGNCEPSDSQECCVCDGIHYTYQASVNGECETRSSCNHW